MSTRGGRQPDRAAKSRRLKRVGRKKEGILKWRTPIFQLTEPEKIVPVCGFSLVVCGSASNYNFLTTSFVVGTEWLIIFHLPFSATSYSLNTNGIPWALEKSK